MKIAKPIFVSHCMEVWDTNGHYVGESRIIVQVKGNCCSNVLGRTPFEAPHACGGNIYHISYMSDADISVIEYRFVNTLFRNRLNTSEKFRQKMLKQIAKQGIQGKYYEK